MAAWPGQSRNRGQLQTGKSRSGRGFYQGGRRVLLMDVPGTEVVWAGESIEKFSRDVLEATFDTMSDRGLQMLQDKAPVDTGELRESCYCVVGNEGTRLLLVVGAEADHALYQELGTSRHAAQPFIRPTFDYLAATVPGILKRESQARGGGL